MPPKKTVTKSTSADHKAALAEGRQLGRIVRSYLEALDATSPKQGRPRTVTSVTAQLHKLESQIQGADPARRVGLIQRRIDLERDLAALAGGADLAELEKAFVAAAKRYSDAKGISYAAWREVGVPAMVLTAAGITRGG